MHSESMNKEEALRKFVKENAIKLASQQTSTDVVKKMRRSFFEKFNLKSGDRFSNDEVAKELTRLIQKSRRMGKQELLVEVQGIPIIGESLSNEEVSLIYDAETRTEGGVLKPEDLSKLTHEEYLRSVEKMFKEHASVQAREEVEKIKAEADVLKQEVLREKESLAKFRSELDALPPNMSLEDLTQTVEVPDMLATPVPPSTWWSEIGLSANPFPSDQGLSLIPKEKYDDIVVQTPFIKEYIQAARYTSEGLLGNTRIVTGDNGSGKTTMFQFLGASVADTRILPIFVILNPSSAISGLNQSMFDQIVDALSKTHHARFGYDPRRDSPIPGRYENTVPLFEALMRDGATTGYLVMIDGLHKGTAFTRDVFEFLQQIQNVQEFYNLHQIPIGFLIAGSTFWQMEFDRTGSLSGSYYQIDEIPPLTEEYAVEAVEKRIKSFVSDLSKAPRVHKETLRLAFQVLSGRLQKPLTFRSFLHHIRTRLESRNYEEIGVSVALHIETVGAVHAFMPSTMVSRNYLDIWADVKQRPALRNACQRILLNMLRHDGISEQSPLFLKNKGAFQILRKHSLIVQHREKGGVAFKWFLSSELATSVLEISRKLSIRPDQVIQAAFEEESSAKTAELGRIYGSPISSLKTMIPTWKDAWPDIVQLLEACLVRISEIDRCISQNRRDQLSVDHLSMPIQNLVDGINILVYRTAEPKSMRWTYLRESWVPFENYESISRFGLAEFEIPGNETALYGLLHEHSQLVTELLQLLQDLIRGEGIVRLSERNLFVEELVQLHELRMRFLLQGYREVIESASTLLESRIRNTIYPAMRCVWGKRAFDRLMPDARKTVLSLPSRGHPRAKRESEANFLYDVTRSQYAQIIFEHEVYQAVFGRVIDSHRKEEFKNMMELAFSLSDRTAHKDTPMYFRQKATEIGDVVKSLPWMLETFHSVSKRFLSESSFEFEKIGHETTRSRFLSDLDLVHASTEIILDNREALDYSHHLIEQCSAKERCVDSLSSVCMSSQLSPELQLSVVRIVTSRGYLKASSGRFCPLILNATESGLAQIGKGKSQTQPS